MQSCGGWGAEEGQATARAKEKGVLQSQLLGTAAGILQPRKFKVSLGKTGEKNPLKKEEREAEDPGDPWHQACTWCMQAKYPYAYILKKKKRREIY